MDKIQTQIHRDLPEFNKTTCLMTLAVAICAWGVFFLTLHFIIVKPFMISAYKGGAKWARKFSEMNNKDQLYYTSYIHAVVHALVSGFGAIFCLFYADGVPNTTWFHCTFYKLHMFDIQKYFQVISIGYLVQDLIFVLLCT